MNIFGKSPEKSPSSEKNGVKAQPILEEFRDDLTPAERIERTRNQLNYQRSWGGGTGIKSPEDIRKSFYTPANYTMRK